MKRERERERPIDSEDYNIYNMIAATCVKSEPVYSIGMGVLGLKHFPFVLFTSFVTSCKIRQFTFLFSQPIQRNASDIKKDLLILVQPRLGEGESLRTFTATLF